MRADLNEGPYLPASEQGTLEGWLNHPHPRLAGEIANPPTRWSDRYKANFARLRSGDPKQIAEVVQDLKSRKNRSGLSQGEERMLQSAIEMLGETDTDT
jgi:RNA polymerase-interacting CarD/CdnL/TRCF family regulator